MGENKDSHLNLYDYFDFPSPQQRVEAKKVFNMENLLLKTITDTSLIFFDTFFEKYQTWSIHINNFSSHLGLHLLLLYYQYEQKPLDIISVRELQSPEGAHKIFFDTFAEDVSLYLISYFDKHLEMFSDLFYLGKGEKHRLSRKKIIYKMKNIDDLRKLAESYKMVEQSQAFRLVKEIRDSFVHNKSSTYYGMNVAEITTGVYASFNSTGISTEKTYNAIYKLVCSYEQLCIAVNSFINDYVAKQNAIFT